MLNFEVEKIIEMSVEDRNISVLMSMVYIKRTDFKDLFSLTIIHRSIYRNNVLFSKVEQKVYGVKRKA